VLIGFVDPIHALNMPHILQYSSFSAGPRLAMSPGWLNVIAALHVRHAAVSKARPRERPAACVQPSELGALAHGVVERVKKVSFPVVHLAPHYVRRTMPSPVAGCHAFLAAGPEPVSFNPKSPQLLLLACRQASGLVLGARLAVDVHPVRVDVTSVYTGAPRLHLLWDLPMLGTR
jgi:hypothetical protein